MYARRMVYPSIRVAAGCLAAALLAAAGGHPLRADDLQLSIDGGRVTLIASAAPLADVLAEWSRVGKTRFVGADDLEAEALTLHLVDVAEAQALHLLLRAALGYVAAPRETPAPGTSRYDRVTILGARRTAGAAAPAGTPLARAAPTSAEPAPAPGGGAGESSNTDLRAQLAQLQTLLDAAGDPGGAAAADDGLPAGTDPAPAGADVALDHLQHLLGAAAGRQQDAGREPEPDDAAPTLVTTPFPGMIVEPGAEQPPRR